MPALPVQYPASSSRLHPVQPQPRPLNNFLFYYTDACTSTLLYSACPTSSMPYLHQCTRSTRPMSPFQPCAYEDPSLLPPSVLVPVKDIQCSDLVTSVQVYQPALLDYILYNPNPGCSTTFSPATRLPVILPFSPPVQDPTCPSSSMPFQFNSRPARTCLSNSSSPALHQCTRSTCHILYQPGLLYP